MEEKRSWWQQIKKRPIVYLVIVYIVFLVFFVFLFTYGFQADWTGFGGYYKVTTQTTVSDNAKPTTTTTKEYVPPKTLWDWMNFLFIAVVTALAAFWTNAFSQRQKQTELEIASDKQREDALQSYIKEISELLLHEKLRESKPQDEVSMIARVRTLTVLPRLDGKRKRTVLQFLHESDLIENDKCIVDLVEADLTGANLADTNLRKAYLLGVDLTGANLMGAVLSEANLIGATVTNEQLAKAKFLSDTTMPDGSIHP